MSRCIFDEGRLYENELHESPDIYQQAQLEARVDSIEILHITQESLTDVESQSLILSEAVETSSKDEKINENVPNNQPDMKIESNIPIKQEIKGLDAPMSDAKRILKTSLKTIKIDPKKTDSFDDLDLELVTTMHLNDLETNECL